MSTKVAVCQVPDTREDIEQSLHWIRRFTEEAAQQDAALVAFPECFLQGYLTESLPARKFALNLEGNLFATIIEQLANYSPMIVFGLIEEEDGLLFNSGVVIKNGVLIGKYRKTHLLEGEKVFTPGIHYPVFTVNDLQFGINICYDTQFPDAAQQLVKQGAAFIICLSNTMMSEKKANTYKHLHVSMRAERSKENKVWLLSADVTGQHDGRIAYGSTSVINPDSIITAQMPFFETGMLLIDIP